MQAWTERAAELLRQLERFWLAEFLALFPERAAQWLKDRGRSSLILLAEKDTIGLRLVSDSGSELASQKIPRPDYSPAAIDSLLQSQGLRRDDVAVGIALAPDKVFARNLLLPNEAARSLTRIVEQDLATRTPFRPDDIHAAFTVTRTPGAGKLAVCQRLVRRDIVEEAVADLGLTADQVAFVDTAGGPSAMAPRILLRAEQAEGGRWLRRGAVALACSAVLLALIAGGSRYWRQQIVLDDLAAQVASARAKAQQVRAAIDKLEQKQATLLRLRSQKADAPGLIDVWEEATRLLPSHSWLSELRLAETPDRREQLVSMTGFSAAAPGLVNLIDRSPFFTDAALTAPIALDPVEQRERFSLQARVSRREPIKRAAQ